MIYLACDIKESIGDVSLNFAKESIHRLEWPYQRLLWLGKRDANCVFYNMVSDLIRKLVRTCRWGIDERNYELPDGQIIQLGTERISAPEIMVSLHKKDGVGVPKLIQDAISGCDSELHQELWKNVVVSGGNSMFPNFSSRLRQELSSVAAHLEARVVCPPERKYSAWIGGSLLASLDSFESLAVSKAKYDEFGSIVVIPKCV